MRSAYRWYIGGISIDHIDRKVLTTMSRPCLSESVKNQSMFNASNWPNGLGRVAEHVSGYSEFTRWPRFTR